MSRYPDENTPLTAALVAKLSPDFVRDNPHRTYRTLAAHSVNLELKLTTATGLLCIWALKIQKDEMDPELAPIAALTEKFLRDCV